ncbi:ATP synthase subunit I [Paenibacillus sepulcri]|uniref:ATP synthase subunit I n=1 Tax=Paenibacillus sepulcri TaxID=359917 RepID=A0ABS7C0J1_9BACL|nr:ATP synthase subunit I [Paenibacillus sepulcri]
MNEIFRKAMRSALYLMSLCIVVWLLVPSLKAIAAGIVAGCAASLFNAYLLRRRIDLLGQIVVDQGPRRMSIGMAGRLATVLFVVMIANKFPQHLNVAATLSASFFVQIAVFLITAVTYSKHSGKG